MQNYPVTPAILLQWYQNYNKLYFDNELPEPTLQNFCLRNYKAFESSITRNPFVVSLIPG